MKRVVEDADPYEFEKTKEPFSGSHGELEGMGFPSKLDPSRMRHAHPGGPF